MRIGGKEYLEVLICDSENNLLVSITDENVIEEKSCKVVYVPVEKRSDRIEELTKPLIDDLKDNYHPYTSIVITPERVAVIETVQSIPKDCIS